MRRAIIVAAIWLSGVLSALGYVAVSGGWYYNLWLTAPPNTPTDLQTAIVDRGCEFMAGPADLVTIGNRGAVLRCPRIKLP